MKYYLDCEFIEDGKTIDLISIGLACESGRTIYLQSTEFDVSRASDWVWANVYSKLEHFSQRRNARACHPDEDYGRTSMECAGSGCPWRTREAIAEEIQDFCDPRRYGPPEFWGYYADYDWVALCQLFGTMMKLPEDWPKYCRDVKQLCDDLGNPALPAYLADKPEHHALNDALWTMRAHVFLLNPPNP